MDAETRYRMVSFLDREAACLDDFRLEEWLDMLAEGFEYRVPVRTTRARGSSASEFSDDAYIFDDDRTLLADRVERLEKEYAWAENPPYRTRRFVSNVRPVDERECRNNLLLAYSKGDGGPRLLTAERHDRFREVDGDLRLAARDVYLDHTVTESIPRFL